MRNFTILTPFSKQVTQDYNNLQKKQVQFTDTEREIEFNCKNNDLFVEKSLKGYCNILAEVSKNDNVYFFLPPCFDDTNVKSFVEDLIVACRYLDIHEIIFDKSRCDNIKSFEKKNTCDEIEFMLLNSEIPLTIVSSDFSKSKYNLKAPYSIFNPESKSKYNKDIRSIHKNLHAVYDLKEAMFLGHFKRIKNAKQSKERFYTGSFSYALN